MSVFRIAWQGPDLYDSIEEEGMTLTARACHRICGELVSGLRRHLDTPMREPWQDDCWASFEFVNLGQNVSVVVSLMDENDYSIAVEVRRGIFGSLLGGRSGEVKAENIGLIGDVLRENARLIILRNAVDKL